MEKQIFFSKSTKETQKIGRDLAEACFKRKKNREGALVVGLSGDLGGGKTNFTKGFAKGLGLKATITSPTFVIQKIYEINLENGGSETKKNTGKEKKPKRPKFSKFFHIDAYRIRGEGEMETIEFPKALKDPSNIIVIEWVENIPKAVLNNFLKNFIKVLFEYVGRNERKIIIEGL